MRNCFVFSFRDGDTDFIMLRKENCGLKVTQGRFFTGEKCDWKLYRGANRQTLTMRTR